MTLVLVAISGLMIAGCNKEMTEPAAVSGTKVLKTISAERNGGFKTSLQDKSVLWTEGDKVAVFGYGEAYDIYDRDINGSVKDINGAKAVITAELKDICTPQYVVYPTSEKTAINTATSEIQTVIPAEYRIAAGSFPNGSNVAAGKVENGKVTMQNLMALLKFEITANDISKVLFNTVAGEALSGTVTIDAAELRISKIEGGSEVSLLPVEGKETFDAGIYYLPVAPFEMKEGFYVRLVDSEGFTAKKIHATTYTPVANKVINLGKQSEWGVDVHVGAVQTGTPSVSGSDIIVSGNSFRIKYPEESADIKFGIEYSNDACATWHSITVEDGFKTTFDVTIPAYCDQRKYHIRSWAQYKNDDKAYGEEQILNLITGPLTFVLNFIDHDPNDLEHSNLKYIGNDPNWSWPTNIQSTASRRIVALTEDRFSYKVDDDLTVYFSIINPISVSSGYYFANDDPTTGATGFCYRDKYIFMSTPALPDFKLDNVTLAMQNDSRKSQMYVKYTATPPSTDVLGDNGAAVGKVTERIGAYDYYMAIHKNLSTVGKKNVSSVNTEHMIYFTTNGYCRQIQYTYVPE